MGAGTVPAKTRKSIRRAKLNELALKNKSVCP